MKPVIVLLTDFGLSDPYVGMMKGVIANINPDTRIIDLTHDIPKYGIEVAAYVLKSTYRYFPKKSIFNVVVDPGVGSARRPLIVRSGNYLFVGPDNGVLLPAATDDGLVDAYEINPRTAGLPEISWTFHGRDIFAPTAALLSLGVTPESLGSKVSVEELVSVDVPPKKPKLISEGTVAITVFYVDSFGNVILSTDIRSLMKTLKLKLGDIVEISTNLPGSRWLRAKLARTFSEVNPGELAVYEGSLRLAEVAVYLSAASRTLGVGAGDIIYLRKAQ